MVHLLVAAGSLSAQTIEICGIVVDSDGEPGAGGLGVVI